jgi:hypothetical protein
LLVWARAHGSGSNRRRVAFYGCTSYWKRGRTVCENRLETSMEGIDGAVLGETARQVLSADIIEEIVERTAAAAAARNPETELERLRRDQADVDAEIARYGDAIGRGGDVPELVAALKARRDRRTELARRITTAERQGNLIADGSLRDEIRRRVEAWRELMTRHATQARQLLRKMLRGRPIIFVPTVEDGQVGYRFRGEASVSELLAGLGNLPLSVASPSRLKPLFGEFWRRREQLPQEPPLRSTSRQNGTAFVLRGPGRTVKRRPRHDGIAAGGRVEK